MRRVRLSVTGRKLLARLGPRKTREREGLFLVEGIRSAAVAVDAGADVVFAVVSPRALAAVGAERVVRRLEVSGVELCRVDDPELASLAATETPQGLILVCREPRRALEELAHEEAAEGPSRPAALRVLLLDGVQDPGNAGTLVRAAAAFGLAGVVGLEGTVDLYNPKVVRASAGGIFRTAVLGAPWTRVAPWLRRQGLRALVSDPSGADVARVDTTPPWALVVGNEGAGVRPELSASADLTVAVPMPGGSESLNAAMAGSILLYVLTRERSIG